MKTKVILLALLARVCGAQAQGLVIFNNTSATKVSTNSFSIFPPASGPIAAGANLYYFALFYSTTATTVHGTNGAVILGNGDFFGTFVIGDPNWTFAGYGVNSSTLPGHFFSSSPNSDGSTTINGVAGGSFAQFVVLGWSANLGSTLAELENSWYSQSGSRLIGESAVSGPIQLGDGALIPASNLFGSSSPLIQGFTLGGIPVPEPTTLALAGAGLAGLFSFRRRSPVQKIQRPAGLLVAGSK